jgi:hypothetical protein
LNESYPSIISKEKLNMLPVQGVITGGGLLMSIVWLTPAAIITPQAAFATAAPSATCQLEAATITGTAGDDNLVGTPSRDVIWVLEATIE